MVGTTPFLGSRSGGEVAAEETGLGDSGIGEDGRQECREEDEGDPHRAQLFSLVVLFESLSVYASVYKSSSAMADARRKGAEWMNLRCCFPLFVVHLLAYDAAVLC